MPVLSAELTYADAKSNGADVFEVLYDQWGNIVPVVDETAYPPVGQPSLQTVYGVSIGPRSTVDRCWLTYDRQKNLTSTYNFLRQLSVRAPITFTQPAKVGNVIAMPTTLPLPADLASVIAYAGPVLTDAAAASAIMYDATYKLTDGSTGIFGPHPIPAGNRVWVAPLLQLYFYLKPPLVAPSQHRAPFITGTYAAGVTLQVDATEQLIGLYPIFGRKTVALELIADNGVEFRIAVIPALNRTSGSGIPQEVDVTTATITAPDSSKRVLINQPMGDYLMVYGTGDAGTTVKQIVVATDD